MADTPARHVYTGNGNTRVFPIPTRIIGDAYVRIEIDGVYQSDRTKWDIVNNSVIFLTAPINGSEINIQVATSEEALSVLGSVTNVDIVADNILNVNNVGDSITDINTISNSILNVINVSDNIASVITVSNDSTEINTLASIHTQLESLYADRTKLTSLYNDKTTLDSIYSDKAKLDAIFSDLNAIESLYSIKTKLESIYADKSKLDSIYADKSKLDSIYADKTQLDTLYNNISNILTVYTNIASVITVSNNIASISTTASNIVDVNTFSSKYKISSTQPSSPTAGDLWYDTIATVLKYYNGSSYVAVTNDINLLLTNTKFISNISIGNTTLSDWTNSFSVIEAPGGTFFASNGISTLTGSNCYYDGANWRYKTNGTAGLQLVNQGNHTFKVATSGTAGSNITWVTIASISDSSTILPSNTSIGNVSSTELQYLSGVTSDVQTQINSKANINANTTGSSGSCTGNSATATKLTNSQSDWVSSDTIANVIGMLCWKYYENGHVIFDASAGTSPSGSAIDNTNPQHPWYPTLPTLMGWNGSSTFGARVDTARYSENGVISSSNSTNGYVKLGNGLIIQWGTSGSGTSLTFPIAFPTAFLNAIVAENINATGANNNAIYISNATTTGLTFAAFAGNGRRYIAIGY